ncbi:prepilin-type N-terminal cleavage/methylation domain-containing protein [bacterium]|nr:prepilin-type N-terminal cleavage/methylation domain-containing protein [bacterium]
MIKSYSMLYGKTKRGFTLVELMIVIAIIAILAAIIVPNFVRSRARATLTACEENEKNIATALELYAADNDGSYPSTLPMLIPKYLKSIPTCPSGGASAKGKPKIYHYHYDIVGKKIVGYMITCHAEDTHGKSMGLGYGCPLYSPYAGGLQEHTNCNEIKKRWQGQYAVKKAY